MHIQILSLLSGAQNATGLTVIIDVLRASNTIIACLASGANSILPVGDLEEAKRLKAEHPDHLLFGERKGLKPKGFDYGNSPALASGLTLKGKDLILTTSAGTQGIVSAKHADEILIGSFANASAIVEHIQRENPNTVSLVAMGESGIEPAVEDELCAKYLKAKLDGKEIDFELILKEILKGEGAARLKRLGQEADLEFCLRLDSHTIIPKIERRSGRIIPKNHPSIS